MAEFKTKLVKEIPVTPARQQAIWIGIAGAVVALAALPLSVFPATQEMPTWAFVIGMALILGATIMVKGNFGGGIQLVDEDILFTPDKIEVGKQSFPLSAVDDLRIVAHSFRKMRLPNSNVSGKMESCSGMSNRILFEYKGEKYSYFFYVNSAKHMYMLGELLTEWYKKKYYFIEYDASGNRTYLFKQRTGAELEEFRRKHNL